MISSTEVQHIAKLARISLSAGEILKFQKDFSTILEYFEILSELNVSSTPVSTHALSLQNVTRQDKAQASQKGQHLLEMAPAQKDGYLKVKSIL